MRNYYLNSIILVLLLVTTNSVATDSLTDGEAIVTLKNNQPCFSFPKDEATKNKRFVLYELNVFFNKSHAANPSTHSWELKIERENRKYYISPNTPENCIEYGIVIPTNNPSVAIPIEINIPYQVFLTVYSLENVSSSGSIRNYHSDFCIVSDKNNKKIVVKSEYNLSRGKFECTK